MPLGVIAYLDESARHGGDGIYVVAVLVDPEGTAAARDGARSVLLRRQRRFHWHDESAEQRRRMLKQIQALGVTCRAYVYRPLAPRREERARALCLNALLWDLWQADVNEVVLERRQAHNDRRDVRTIVGAKAAKRAAPQLRYRFVGPDAEPLLWLADAVASATSAVVAGSPAGAEYLALLDQLERCDVAP